MAEQDEFELPVPVLELLPLSARRTRTAMAPLPLSKVADPLRPLSKPQPFAQPLVGPSGREGLGVERPADPFDPSQGEGPATIEDIK